MVNVSHNDAVAFCEWLSRKEGRKYRLPTEAEWEYACRAGTASRYYNGEDPEGLTKIANVWDAATKEKVATQGNTLNSIGWMGVHKPRGPFSAEQLRALRHDWECVGVVLQIGIVTDYYLNSPDRDPTGPDSGSYRVLRGGGWGAYAWTAAQRSVATSLPGIGSRSWASAWPAVPGSSRRRPKRGERSLERRPGRRAAAAPTEVP